MHVIPTWETCLMAGSGYILGYLRKESWSTPPNIITDGLTTGLGGASHKALREYQDHVQGQPRC